MCGPEIVYAADGNFWLYRMAIMAGGKQSRQRERSAAPASPHSPNRDRRADIQERILDAISSLSDTVRRLETGFETLGQRIEAIEDQARPPRARWNRQ